MKEWELASLRRGKYRISLFRIAEGETICDVLDGGAAQVCMILTGDLGVGRAPGRTRIVGTGEVAAMAGPGTFCLHANLDTVGLRGSIHTETPCTPDPPRRPPGQPSWTEVLTGVATGGALFGTTLGLWLTLRTRQRG